MNKTLDVLSKNLASGMSRRKAFTKFLAGAGALGFLLTGKASAKKAKAIPVPAYCIPECMAYAEQAYQCCLDYGGTSTECFDDALMNAYQCCLTECSEAAVIG